MLIEQTRPLAVAAFAYREGEQTWLVWDIDLPEHLRHALRDVLLEGLRTDEPVALAVQAKAA